MTISVADTIQDMFNEFVTKKGITKTSALTSALDDVLKLKMYMIAEDENLYLELKKKYLGVEAVKNMVEDRDSTVFDIKQEFIFMKLGVSEKANGDLLDGEETMELYIADEEKRGYTWFSTQSLFYGMSQKRIDYYNKKIESGKNVKMLFAVNNENFDNDIAFLADVLKVFSAKVPVSCPEDNAYPAQFDNEKAKIWIKLANITNETDINASMLQITSTGRDLKQTISNTQYHFGYVSFKE